MISEQVILNKFIDFTKVAAPVLSLKDEQAYEDALTMMEHLMESVGEERNKPENILIGLLAHAIEEYESKDEEISDFVSQSMSDRGDVALLRMIIDQHQLTLSDLPEVGHKSLISKILSGERNLTRSHIEKLSKRFHIDPGLFF
ncbi:TPA: transcriptional regulator [Legionella pneumophila]|nr:transcriptional regulator [Legionella pneumophila]